MNSVSYAKEILSAVAIGLTIASFFPYVASVLRGVTKPHVFSWAIWGSTTLVVFAAQLADGGGVGAWPIGFSGLVTIYVAGLAYTKRSDITITRTDWLFLLAAATSLPCWYLSADPLWAVVILTAVDVMGFGPTFRKAIDRPFDEQLSFFVLMAARNTTAAVALEHYSLTTLMFPVVMAGVCVAFIVTVLRRRRVALAWLHSRPSAAGAPCQMTTRRSSFNPQRKASKAHSGDVSCAVSIDVGQQDENGGQTEIAGKREKAAPREEWGRP